MWTKFEKKEFSKFDRRRQWVLKVFDEMSQRDKTRKIQRKQQNFQDSVQQKWNFCATESLQIIGKRNKEKKGKQTATK
jgi:hypothetical protein